MNILRRGTVLRLDRGEVYLVVVLLERASQNGWNCMVVGGTSETYTPGGWDIFVFDQDLQSAEEVRL